MSEYSIALAATVAASVAAFIVVVVVMEVMEVAKRRPNKIIIEKVITKVIIMV